VKRIRERIEPLLAAYEEFAVTGDADTAYDVRDVIAALSAKPKA
jgi:hypothetical protein